MEENQEITVEDFLYHKTKVGDIVVFRNNGWREGLVKIDHEDLFIHIFNSKFLSKIVKSVRENEWFEIKPGTKIQVTEIWY